MSHDLDVLGWRAGLSLGLVLGVGWGCLAYYLGLGDSGVLKEGLSLGRHAVPRLASISDASAVVHFIGRLDVGVRKKKEKYTE